MKKKTLTLNRQTLQALTGEPLAQVAAASAKVASCPVNTDTTNSFTAGEI